MLLTTECFMMRLRFFLCIYGQDPRTPQCTGPVEAGTRGFPFAFSRVFCRVSSVAGQACRLGAGKKEEEVLVSSSEEDTCCEESEEESCNRYRCFGHGR